MIMPPLLTLFGKHNNNRTGKTFWHLLSFTINMVMSHKVKVISYELSFRKTYVSKTGNIFYQFVLSDSTKVLGTPMSSSETWIQKTLNKLLVLNVDGCKHNNKPSQRKSWSLQVWAWRELKVLYWVSYPRIVLQYILRRMEIPFALRI